MRNFQVASTRLGSSEVETSIPEVPPAGSPLGGSPIPGYPPVRSTRIAWRLRPWNVMSDSLSATDSRRMVLVPSSWLSYVARNFTSMSGCVSLNNGMMRSKVTS